MHSSCALYLFAFCLVLVHCRHHHATEQERPHVFEPADSCTAHEIRKQLMLSKKEAYVKPRMMAVPLMPHSGYEYDPNVVFVSRCGGHCTGRNAPTATSTNMTKVVVRRYSTGQSDSKECGTVEVENHIACKCMCDKAYNNCNTETHDWDPENCDCKCKKSFLERKKDCKLHTLMEWDATRCVCQCKQKIMDCMTGLHWNPKTCSCMPN